MNPEPKNIVELSVVGGVPGFGGRAMVDGGFARLPVVEQWKITCEVTDKSGVASTCLEEVGVCDRGVC